MNVSILSALAWGGVLAAGVLWGGGALVAHGLMAQGMSPASLALARFALGLPLLWWWHAAQRGAGGRWRALPLRHRMLVAGSGVAMALNVTCWFAAIALMGATLPTVISICCAPLFVAGVSVLRGYERASWRLGVALVLALCGVVLIVRPASGWVLPAGHALGVGLSLASAALQAGVVLANARMPAAVSPVSASAWGMTAAALAMALVVLPQGLTWPVGTMGWLGVAYTGVVTTSVAYLLFAWGSRRITPTAAGLGILVEPLATALLAAWLLSQPLAPLQWAGAALMGAALALMASAATYRSKASTMPRNGMLNQ
ncbi:MAG: DMT family transporter [Proteobacteria bacterium]|jgi:DME family drug/metabolite transporter|nr:DMT family transporter [Pseudomonadota bacterium]